MLYFTQAKQLIQQFKGGSYVFGTDVLPKVGTLASELGRQASLVYAAFPGNEGLLQAVEETATSAGLQIVKRIEGADPNAPREDLLRITDALKAQDSDLVISFGGGSTIDATKAAEVLRTLGGEIDDYFGTGKVSAILQESGKTLTPLFAIQTASSSGAHLTKYSNITDVTTGQKKLIVDDAIVPSRALFDYAVTKSMPPNLTLDGAFDGIAHVLEVFYGAVGKPYYDQIIPVAETAISLVVTHIERAINDPADIEARTALGLATDLGGYAIMIGGTNGGHLTSFSLVDILSHGRACAIMNPYYTVFFAPSIEAPLTLIGQIYKDAGLIKSDIAKLHGRDLGVAVAQGMMALSDRVGFPTALNEVEGFSEAHIERALTAAKDPQLKMKLENMPVPLTADMIDDYMAPILWAAKEGDLTLIRNVTD
jgi:alcohol dehydrogenase class IV